MDQALVQLCQWLLNYADANQGALVATVIMALGWIITIIASFMPAPTEASSIWYKLIYTPVNYIAMNIGKAKNHDDTVNKMKDLNK